MLNDNVNIKDYVISSHIRFYRNVSEIPFAAKISSDDADDINHHVTISANAVWGEEKYMAEQLVDRAVNPYLKDTEYTPFPNDTNISRGLFTSPDGRTTVLTNESEHLIISSDADGLDIDTAYSNACEMVNSLSSHMPFATSDSLGFITANPHCVGLGMTVAVLMHLPALCIAPYFNQVKERIKNYNIDMDCYYCDKKFPFGAMFYITNKYTLGLSEEDAIESVKKGVEYLINQEDNYRSWLLSKKKTLLQDTIWRSIGTLATARRLNPAEFIVNISNVRLGACAHEFDIPLDTIDDILKKGAVPYIKKYMARNDIEQSESTDIVRARIMREEFSPILKSLL